MLVVAAECRILPDHWQDFEDSIIDIVESVRSEPGCLRYDITTSIEEPGLFIILEEWESRDHLNAHLETVHINEHNKKTAEWAKAPIKLSIYENVSVQRIEI